MATEPPIRNGVNVVKITKMKADGFGVWNDLTIDNLSPDLTVFYGRNEAGKTTLMQFIRSVLYGYTAHRRQRYLPPVYGGVGGGSLQILQGAEDLQVQRLALAGPSEAEGELRVVSAEGHQFGGEYLTRLLSGIDESIFTNVFALGLTEIQELNALNGTEAANELYKLASGVDRVSLVDVMNSLTQRREALLAKGQGRLIELFDRHRDVAKIVEHHSQSGTRWVEMMSERKELQSILKSHKARLSQLELESRRLSMARQVFPYFTEWRNKQSELELLADLPDERDVDLAKNARLKQRLNELEAQAQQLQSKGEDLRATADELPINPAVQKNMNRIEAIVEHQHWIQSLTRQADRLKNEIQQLQQEHASPSSDPDADTGDTIAIPITRSMMRHLGPFAKQLKTAQRQLENAREQLAESEVELQELREQLNLAMSENDCESLGESFQHTGQLVGLLRKRQGLEERVGQLSQQRKVAEVDLDDAIQDQVFSPQRMMGVGAFIVIGVALILGGWSGMLINDMPYEPLLGFFGCGVVLAGLGLKRYWEYESQDEVDQAKQQFESIRDELEAVRDERQQMDQMLPDGLGQGDSKLLDAQRRLNILERLLPMEGRVTESTEQFDQAKSKVGAAESQCIKSQQLWQESLSEIGLPENLTPTQVRRMSERSQELSQARNRLSEARQQLAQFEEDLSELHDRILDIYNEIGLTPQTDANHVELLRKLEAEVKEQQILIDQRRSLASEHKKLNGQWTVARNRLQRLKLFKTQMYTRVGADSEAEFLLIGEKLKRKSELEHELVQAHQRVTSGISHPFQADDIIEVLEESTTRSLEAELQELVKKIEIERSEQEQGHIQEGVLNQQIKQLLDEDGLDNARLELKEIEREIAAAATQWQELAGTLLLLESLREFYETHRQPETLRQASKYLEQITGGRYQRLWTRMVGSELLVDGPDEKGLSIEVLSRGTREAVFLSLRLALVEAYRQRGISLPMVLDDVLVNFDSERSHFAAKVLHQFARDGHQILMFSCHEHMAELFSDIGCDVRYLPYHRDVVHQAATKTRTSSPQLIVESLSDTIQDEETVTTENDSLETLEEIEEVIEQELEEESADQEALECEETDFEDAHCEDDGEEEEDEDDEYDEDEDDEYDEDEDEEVEEDEDDLAEEDEVEDTADEVTSIPEREPVHWEASGLWWQDEDKD
jgi:uncharacterized protein YhaN